MAHPSNGVEQLEGEDPELALPDASAPRSLRRRSSELSRWGSPLRGLSPRSASGGRSNSFSKARARLCTRFAPVQKWLRSHSLPATDRHTPADFCAKGKKEQACSPLHLQSCCQPLACTYSAHFFPEE